jgi:hypothetical protein
MAVAALLGLVALVEHQRVARTAPPEEGSAPWQVSRSSLAPPPAAVGDISRWRRLPAANRQRLLGVLSRLLERRLRDGGAGGAEADDDARAE